MTIDSLILYLPIVAVFACGENDASVYESKPIALELAGAGTYECTGQLEAYSSDPANNTIANLVLQVGLDCLRSNDAFGVDLALSSVNAQGFLDGEYEPESGATYYLSYRDDGGATQTRAISAAAFADADGRFQIRIRLGEGLDQKPVDEVVAATSGRWPVFACRVSTDTSGTLVRYDTEFESEFCQNAIVFLGIERFPSISPR